MIAIGGILIYAGYTGVLWGYALVSGKNIGLKQLFGSAWPPQVPGASGTGTSASSASTGSGGSPNVDVQTSAGASQNTSKYFDINGGT
jgi:hypothetical protein